jgi:hypothetical protein
VKNVLATVALASTLTGTAVAATMYGSSSLATGAVRSADVKNGQVSSIKFTTTAKTWFKDQTGAVGDTGPVGDQGDAGDDAYAVTSWAYLNTGLIRDWAHVANDATTYAVPNDDNKNWSSSTYGSQASGGTNKPQISTGGHQTLNMDGNAQMVAALSGMNIGVAVKQQAQTKGAIVLPAKSNLSATANITMLHKGDPGGPYDGGRISGRVECKLMRANQASPPNFTLMGSPLYYSSDTTNDVVNFTIAANAKDVAAGTYNVAIYCVDADYTGSTQWAFVSASMNVLAAEQ